MVSSSLALPRRPEQSGTIASFRCTAATIRRSCTTAPATTCCGLNCCFEEQRESSIWLFKIDQREGNSRHSILAPATMFSDGVNWLVFTQLRYMTSLRRLVTTSLLQESADIRRCVLLPTAIVFTLGFGLPRKKNLLLLLRAQFGKHEATSGQEAACTCFGKAQAELRLVGDSTPRFVIAPGGGGVRTRREGRA